MQRAATIPHVPSTERTAIHRLVAALARPLVRVFFRPQARGLENVLAGGGFVLSSNQLSNLDGVALSYVLYPRQLWWTAKAELFVPMIGPIARRLGCFPVRRGEGDLSAVGTAVELPSSGYAIGIFPEGTRRSKGLRKKHVVRPRRLRASADPLPGALHAGGDGLERRLDARIAAHLHGPVRRRGRACRRVCRH